ncbi:hypothetical protein [Nonomuraea sp. C10]|uniref:hypothetical protein n=1 Tax=Nonomuraea sp. C10 TaxID=2600577 RepID=UPI0011CE1328|nr:hypothetical protein [Nonomuraea sp. C10]TXK40072.1 hypothetical protein FR742_11175 [Nonomuraea sp. C10]
MALSARRPAQVLRLVLVLALTLTAGAVLSAPAALAAAYRSATSSGWGPSPAAGKAAAEANARAALNQQAAAAGEVCSGVSVTTRHLYTAPDGSAWIYEATASGNCEVPPPVSYTVPRTETRQAGGTSPNVAVENGAQAARAALLAAGQACTGYATTSSLVYTAPGGVWWIYDVTVSATCTH